MKYLLILFYRGKSPQKLRIVKVNAQTWSHMGLFLQVQASQELRHLPSQRTENRHAQAECPSHSRPLIHNDTGSLLESGMPPSSPARLHSSGRTRHGRNTEATAPLRTVRDQPPQEIRQLLWQFPGVGHRFHLGHERGFPGGRPSSAPFKTDFPTS